MSEHYTTLLAAIFGALSALMAWLKSMQNAEKIRELHVSIDGRLQDLLKVTAAASRAEGRQEGLTALQSNAARTEDLEREARLHAAEIEATARLRAAELEAAAVLKAAAAPSVQTSGSIEVTGSPVNIHSPDEHGA